MKCVFKVSFYRFEKHYNTRYAKNHDGKLPNKMTFTDSKTSRESIAQYVQDVMFAEREERYTLTDVVGFDIVDQLYTWFTSYNAEYELDDFVLDYMSDSGVKTGRYKERIEYLDNEDADIDF